MKIMLDECLTQAPARVLIDFFALDNISAHFLVDYFGQQGEKDKPWAEVLAEEGGWFVITADRDRKKKSVAKRMVDGPPLHKVLPGLGISAVYLSGKIQTDDSQMKVRAVTSTWPDTKHFFLTAPAGSRRIITKVNKGFRVQEF